MATAWRLEFLTSEAKSKVCLFGVKRDGVQSCVRAGAFFLRRLLQKVDCENLNFGGAVRGQTQLPQRDGDGGTCEVAWGICGAGSSSGIFCLRQGFGQEAGSGKLVWPEFAGAIFCACVW